MAVGIRLPRPSVSTQQPRPRCADRYGNGGAGRSYPATSTTPQVRPFAVRPGPRHRRCGPVMSRHRRSFPPAAILAGRRENREPSASAALARRCRGGPLDIPPGDTLVHHIPRSVLARPRQRRVSVSSLAAPDDVSCRSWEPAAVLPASGAWGRPHWWRARSSLACMDRSISSAQARDRRRPRDPVTGRQW
jgi:hypothetical protein